MEEIDIVPTERDYPIADAMRAEVLKNYVPDGDFSSSQLTLRKGDIVWVLERHSSGWWGGHKEGDDLTGWFPRALVRPTGDDGGDGGLGDGMFPAASRERLSPSSSPRGAELALFTCDHRAVASPQTAGSGRRRLTIQAGPERQQESTALAELQEMGRRLELVEKELVAERCRAAESAEAAAKAQAEITQLRQEREKERQERERERQLLEQERDRERQAWEQFTAQRQAHAQETRRLHEDTLRREVHGSVEPSHVAEVAEAHGSVAVTGTASAAAPSHPAEPAASWWLQEGGSHLSASKDDNGARVSATGGGRAAESDTPHRRQGRQSPASIPSRGASTGVSQRLLPHVATTPLEGSRTPPGGPPPMPVPVAAGSVSAPTVPTIAAVPTVPLTSTTSSPQLGGSLSARHNLAAGPHGASQPPRPTPRTAATAPPWMASAPAGAATVGVPSSPCHRPRQFTATAVGRDDGTKIEVRALVSAFERRSNSQGAPQTHRVADPSPGRQLLYAGNSGIPSSRPIGSSSRAASREERCREADEESGTAVNFGMSPMQRRPHMHVGRQGIAPSSSSPSKAPVSVQDRIRQLNGGRFGR
uniref:SH3 domain-containing protein n=1 Tax=Pyrodinium bahamense TaxID=73915 RepID=A0A7S0AG65_9DINO